MTVVDYAFSPHPPISSLQGSGIQGVGRYVSESAENDDNGKNLTPPENDALRAAGISVVLFAEEGATDMLGGFAVGKQRAQHFQAVVDALKRPDAIMVCTADFDATPAQQSPINDYLDGAASELGRSRTALYGGYYPVSRALNAGKVQHAVQTFAWSRFSTAGAFTVSGDTELTDLLGNPFTLDTVHDQSPTVREGNLALAKAASLPPHAVLVRSVASRALPGTFLFDDRVGLRQGTIGTLGGASVDFDHIALPDYCQHPRPTSLPAGAHLTDGKTSLGEYARQRNYTDALTWLVHQERLSLSDTVKLADSAIPPAGMVWHTNP